jgi:cobalamin biosynthesis Mg chelatase CobN
MARRGAARLALLAVIVTTLVIGAAPTALAACHAFRVAVQPASVAEGGEVTVTVSRDGAVAASRIDVETIDGTALRGADYVQVARRTISFTNEVEQSFEVATVDNAEAEPSETFRLHLSNPGGCAVNTNFDVGPDAVVTITDADRAPTTSAPTPTSPPTTAAKPTTSTTAGSTTTAPGSGSTTSIEASASSSASTTTTDGGSTTTELRGEELAADEDGGGGGGPLIVGALVVLAGAGAAGWWLVRRRAAG